MYLQDITPKINLILRATGSGGKVVWKVKDVTANKIVYQGQASEGSRTIDAIQGHKYNVAAITKSGAYARVTPESFTMNTEEMSVVAVVSGAPPATTCKVNITSDAAIVIKVKDSSGRVQFSNGKVTAWSPVVSCGLVNVAATDDAGRYATVLPSSQQMTSPKSPAAFSLVTQIQMPSGSCALVGGETCNQPCAGHISVCSDGLQSADWKIINLQNTNQIFTGGGLGQQYRCVDCGQYMIIFDSPFQVLVSPSTTFTVYNGHTTSVKFSVQSGTPTTPGGTTSGGGGGGPSYYPSETTTQATAVSDLWTTLQTYWGLYKWYIVAAAGGGYLLWSNKAKISKIIHTKR